MIVYYPHLRSSVISECCNCQLCFLLSHFSQNFYQKILKILPPCRAKKSMYFGDNEVTRRVNIVRLTPCHLPAQNTTSNLQLDIQKRLIWRPSARPKGKLGKHQHPKPKQGPSRSQKSNLNIAHTH